MNNITFKASFISASNIKKLKNDKYIDKKVSFVELNSNSINDIESLKDVYYNWDYKYNLIRDIWICFRNKSENKKSFEKERLFAITDQPDSFEKLDSSRILGLLQITKEDDNSTEIDLLQVNPEYLKTIESSTYKRIGTALIESLLKLLPDKEFFLFSYDTAVDFYKKLGFQLCDGKCNMMKLIRK